MSSEPQAVPENKYFMVEMMSEDVFCDQWQGQRLQLQGDEDLSIQKSKNSGVTAKWQT